MWSEDLSRHCDSGRQLVAYAGLAAIPFDEGDVARGAEHERAKFGEGSPHGPGTTAMPSASVSASGSRRAFGWIKTITRQEKTKLRDRDLVGWAFTFAAPAYNLVRVPKLIAVSMPLEFSPKVPK